MKTLHLIFIATALLGTLGSCSHSATTEKLQTLAADAPIAVLVLTVAPTSAPLPVITSGQFTTDDATLLGFKIAGVINKIYVEENQSVKAGQLLATLNQTEIDATARQAELALEKAQRDLKRTTTLYKDSVATLEQLQNDQTKADLAQKQLEAVNFNKKYAQIRAPRAGVITKKLANAGQVVSIGTSVLQTTGTGAGQWRLRVGVADREWALIAVGNAATLATDLPGLSAIPATVTSKAETADPINNTYTIELTPTKPVKNLANGLFAKASIITRGGVGQVLVPYAALLDGDKGEAYLYITTNGTTVQRKKVTIASIERDHARISAGLAPGDRVIVTGSPYLTDGAAIKIQ